MALRAAAVEERSIAYRLVEADRDLSGRTPQAWLHYSFLKRCCADGDVNGVIVVSDGGRKESSLWIPTAIASGVAHDDRNGRGVGSERDAEGSTVHDSAYGDGSNGTVSRG
jgi:hypothetical protein